MIFDKLFKSPKLKDYLDIDIEEQETPANTVFATMALVLAELIKTQEALRANQAAVEKAKRLKALGFGNSYEVSVQAEHDKNVELYMFMVEMWRDLGRQTMLVSYKHFLEILETHDLVCGDFNRYKGDIPQKNLEEIESAKSKLYNSDGSRTMPQYADLLQRPSHIVSTSRDIIDIVRFPFHYKGRKSPNESNAVTVKSNILFENELFIAAPRSFMTKPTFAYKPLDYRMLGLIYDRADADKERRNADVANRLLEHVADYVNIEYIKIPEPQPVRLPKNFDPFVCTLCKYGVIIHSMWGPEAEDATIKRYEQLRDAIIGNEQQKLIEL